MNGDAFADSLSDEALTDGMARRHRLVAPTIRPRAKRCGTDALVGRKSFLSGRVQRQTNSTVHLPITQGPQGRHFE